MMQWAKKYHMQTGAIMALFIALLGYIFRLYREEQAPPLLAGVSSFLNTCCCWLLIQAVLQSPAIQPMLLKGLISIFAGAALSILVLYLRGVTAMDFPRLATYPRPHRLFLLILILRGLIVTSFLFFIAYILQVTTISQQARLENERLKQENLQARLSLLKEQISPHFLFNSLGTLRSITKEKHTREFIRQLANVYRYLLNSHIHNLAPLRDELEFTRAYLYILQERFEAALQLDFHIADSVLEKQLPTASLQLLIENALKHNIASIDEPLRIRVFNEGADILTVQNTLQLKNSPLSSNGIGLQNIRDRYLLLSGKDIRISQDQRLFAVQIPLLDGNKNGH